MTTPAYRDFILEGIDGLPSEALAEIAGFVYLVRRRVLQPQALDEELQNALLGLELKQLSRSEEAHLEEEFADYDRLIAGVARLTDRELITNDTVLRSSTAVRTVW